MQALLPELASYRAADTTPRIDVPIAFIQGGLDMATPTALARRYFDALIAPRGKHWVELPQCAHFPMWEQPEEFAEALEATLQQNTQSPHAE